MPQFTTRSKEQIEERMLAKLIARTDLSDVSDVSVAKAIIAAAATSDDEQYYQMSNLLTLMDIRKNKGVDLDERAAEILPDGLSRGQLRKATGQIIFYRTTTTGTTVVQKGTVVMTVSGIRYVTTAAATITASSVEQIAGHGVGRDAEPVGIIAEEFGSSGNVIAGSITKFASKPIGIDGVTNLDPTVNGSDYETDPAFLARIIKYTSSLARATHTAVEAAVLNLVDEDTGATILYAKAVDDITYAGDVYMYIDDGTGTIETTDTVSGEIMTEGLVGPPSDTAVGGEQRLYVVNTPIKTDGTAFVVTSSTRGALSRGVDYTLDPCGGLVIFDPPLSAGESVTVDYTFYTGLIALAHKVIYGDPGDSLNYPGYKGGGTRWFVRSPQIVLQNITLRAVLDKNYDPIVVRTAIKSAIKTFVNSFGRSQDLLLSDLIVTAKRVPGVIDIKVDYPTSDVNVYDYQLMRTTDSNLTVN